MKIFLAVDTSNNHLAVMAMKNGVAHTVFIPDCAMKHSVSVMPAVEEALKKADMRLEECDFFAAVVGAGNLGMAFVKSPMFEKRGVDVVAMFDVNEDIIGKKVSGISVYSMDELEKKLEEYGVHIVILTLPKEYAGEIMERLDGTKVRGVWNFTGKDIGVTKKGMAIENVHIGDSLMALCYEIAKDFE